MVEVTEADREAIPQDVMLSIPAYLREALHQYLATHRIEAAKAERDRLHDWLNGAIALLEKHSYWIPSDEWLKIKAEQSALADALESQP